MRKGEPIDYNKETKIYWSRKSPLPLSVEGLIALTWISMVASFPLMTKDHVYTKTQLLLAAVMWCVLALGVYLFHHVFMFQSAHFEGIRSLTMVECVYFMAQVLTTVGYGDITPAKPLGQIFVGIYVIFSLMVIMNFVSEVMNNIADKIHRTWEYVIQHENVPPRIRNRLVRTRGEEKTPSLRLWVPKGLRPLPWTQFRGSLIAYTIICSVGIAFYTCYPGENKTLLQAMYMSVITLSTVGFGAVTPLTEGGKVFAAFWMLVGSTALVRLIGSFSQLMNALKICERWDVAKAEEHDCGSVGPLPEHIDKTQFLKFALIHAEVVAEKDLLRIEAVFERLQPEADGTISKDAVLDFFRSPH